MNSHYPKGTRYTAFEKNVLKYRAYEMVLILFHVQQLRGFVIHSIRATSRLAIYAPESSRGSDELEGRALERRAWDILVEDGILTPEERAEIKGLIDYRNVVAHATERITVDVNRNWRRPTRLPFNRYDRKALGRLEALTRKITEGMSSKYVISLSLEPDMFEPAEKAYREELARLEKKIKKQFEVMKEEWERVRKDIASLPVELLDRFEPGHPRHRSRNGTLSKHGVECCHALFYAGATPLAVAYLMRLSLRASKTRFNRWKSENRGTLKE